MSPLSVSIIVPCRNEAKFIAKFLDSLLANDYPKTNLEVLVVDGMSDDGTRDIIKSYSERYGFINLLDNAKKITPTALNLGIQCSKGEVIMRMDVHSEYPTNYISGLLSALVETGADNVGGLWVTRPGKNTLFAEAIAIAVAHPFGVGNSHYKIGVSEPRWVDTVPFGCYRREVFDRIGLFDEELVRNQDDEFNSRLIKNGGKILLVPHIISYYYARDSLRKVWQMHYQYGYFKPLVIRKIGGVLTIRQLVPGAFVAALGGLTVLVPWSGWALLLDKILISTYLLANLSASWIIAAQTQARYGLALPLVFSTMHFGYGFGFLKGAIDFLLFRRSGSDIGLSR
jgi:glycosyltransferase involved in cell wall biosynthesis